MLGKVLNAFSLGAETMNWTSLCQDNPFVSSELQQLLREGKTRVLNPAIIVLLLVILSAWFLVSYLTASILIDKRFAVDLERHSKELKQTTAAVKYQFDRSLSFLQVLPATVADNLAIMTAMRSLDYQALEGMHSFKDKVSFLKSKQDLIDLNQHLAEQQKNLDVNEIWLLAPNGECVASSNFATPESFIGISYSDREYFKTAIAGQRGRQYAVGRQTNIPGLFFSAPIKDGDNIIGAVIVKIDISKFSQWLSRFNCFITDTDGVIILSSDKILENYALVDAPIFHLSSEARDKKYKRTEFSELKISRYENKYYAYPTIHLPGSDSFYILIRSDEDSYGYGIFTYEKIAEEELLSKEKWQITFLFFISGATLIILVAGIRLYLRDMRDSLEAARAANNAKSAFLANMSHEIRTPMNAILGMSYLVLQSDLNSKQREQVAYLHNAAGSLLGIINDILDFSKVESGKMTLEPSPFVLNDMLNQVIQLIKPKIEERRLEFHYAEQDRLLVQNMPLFIGDELRLRQVLINLLSNAVKFTEKGFVRLGVSSSVLESAINVIITIQDSGIGIKDDQIERLFDEFTQADDSTSRKYGGTGLGLAIVRRLVTLMRGKVTVESQPDLGSCFTVEIPFELALAGQSPLTDRRRKIENYDLLRGIRVLLVEDSPVNRLLAVELLAMKGVMTDTAENGKVALQKLQSVSPETFDVVLMDLQMPVLDGFETTCLIRSDARFDSLPIIALSAHVMSSERERCSQIGMNGYINKPFDPDHLWHTLSRAIRKDGPSTVDFSPQFEQEHGTSNPETSLGMLDFQQGIKRAGGDLELYFKLVEEFLNEFDSGSTHLLHFAHQKEWNTGHAYTHKLRGALGTLGAEKMSSSLASVEEAFRIGADPSEQILELEKSYPALMEALRRYLKSADRQKTVENISEIGDSGSDMAWIEEFTDYLGHGDFQAIELWENHKTSLADRISPADFEQISVSLQMFDFALALKYFQAGVAR